MKEENANTEEEVYFDEFGELRELEFGGKSDDQSREEYERKEEHVEENLWYKLESAGKKISFAKDIVALYRYMKDALVGWHRKAIVIAALIYFISPVDAIPDIAPLFGYLDDLGVISALLKFLGSELIPYYDSGYRV
ncbi:MAG: YkvA family protein [Ignavibacteria bacterium]|nr:YkvA family protein [Ignavibacteria bacterium]